MGLINHIVRVSKPKHSALARFALIVCAASIFLVCVPALLIWSTNDPVSAIQHPRHLTSGLIIAILGLYLASRAVWTLFTVGQGTSLPIMATQELAGTGPYTLCRNPMVLGVVLFYLGISICLWNIAPLLITVGIASVLIGYIKLVEEKEVALRFGEAYEEYRQSKPFIIPRWRDILKFLHCEGIPWPFSIVYNAISGTDIFRRHYELVAADIARYGTPHRILDVGTGPGRLLLVLHQAFPDAGLVGVDISTAMIAAAERNLKSILKKGLIEVKVAGVNDLPFENGSFDRVVSTAAFHHWTNPIQALAEIHRVLRNDGYALIYDLVKTMPNEVRKDVRLRFGRFRLALLWLHSFEEPFLNAEEMEALGRQSDFTVEGTKFIGALCCLVLKKTANSAGPASGTS